MVKLSNKQINKHTYKRSWETWLAET